MEEARYVLPAWLEGRLTPERYRKWIGSLARSAADRAIGHRLLPGEYKSLVHKAVIASEGRCHYTGRQLAWEQLRVPGWRTKLRGWHRRGASDCPTLDHVNGTSGAPAFVLCSDATNVAKGYLSGREFRKLCKAVLVHEAGRKDPALAEELKRLLARVPMDGKGPDMSA